MTDEEFNQHLIDTMTDEEFERLKEIDRELGLDRIGDCDDESDK